MNSKQIIYLSHLIKKNDPIYDKNGELIGYYTGYGLRPTHKSNGAIEIQANNVAEFISGNAMHISGFGLKFVEDFEIC